MVATPTRTPSKLSIVWEKLPADFILPDDPVDNINQPPLAHALTESLSLSGYLSPSAFTASNYGISTKVEGKTVVKAPDWVWVPATKVPREEIERSYTPHLEGDIPLVVMEFLSYTEGGEYSIKSSYPPGKWFYYEQVLQVPYYAIFQPSEGTIEAFSLADRGIYERIEPSQDGRYWLADVNLSLGTWKGTHLDRTGYWLRWWDADGQILLWGDELTERERQKAEQLQRRAIAKLIELGLSAEVVADTLNLKVEDVRRNLS